MTSQTHGYMELPGGVRFATVPSARGYRVRWTTPDGRRKDTYRIVFEDARALAYELAGVAVRADAGTPRHDGAPVSMLISDYLETAEERGTIKPQTLRSRRTYLNKWAMPVIGGWPCHAWTRDGTWAVVERARTAGLAPSTVSSIVRALSAVAHFGAERGYLEPGTNPAQGLRLPVEKINLDLPAAEQVEKLANCIVELTGEPWAALQVYLPCYAGLRVGEMLGLHGSDFDLQTGELHLQRQLLTSMPNQTADCKYGSNRTTIWPAWMDDMVADHVNRVGDGPLFVGTRYTTYMPYSTFLGQRFTPGRDRAGWPRSPGGRHRWTVHTLRHYFCTWALAKDGLNLDVADVARLAGHRSPETTWSIYVTSRPDRTSRAREASRSAAR